MEFRLPWNNSGAVWRTRASQMLATRWDSAMAYRLAKAAMAENRALFSAIARLFPEQESKQINKRPPTGWIHLVASVRIHH